MRDADFEADEIDTRAWQPVRLRDEISLDNLYYITESDVYSFNARYDSWQRHLLLWCGLSIPSNRPTNLVIGDVLPVEHLFYICT